MKPLVQLATLAFVFGAAIACSDMTTLDPDLGTSGGRGGGSVGSNRGGSSGASSSSGAKSAASGGSGGGKTASGGQRTAAAGGRASSTGGSGGSSSAGGAGVAVNVAPSGSAKGAGGAGAGGGGAMGAAGKASIGIGAGAVAGEAGSAGAGGSREPPRTSPPFFSEYIEGSGNNKALELASIEPGRLDGCVIRIYANGALSASRSIVLSGPIEPNIPVVICSPQLSDLTGFSCEFTETLPFNGNDAIVLSCAGEVVDSIGQLGSDPGEQGWGSGALRTQDRTLRRQCAVTEGDREPSDPFELAADGWVASGSDVFDGLGVRCEPTADDGSGGAGGAANLGGDSGLGGAEAGGSSAAGSPDEGGSRAH